MTSVPIERRGDYIVKMTSSTKRCAGEVLTRYQTSVGWPSAVLTKD